MSAKQDRQGVRTPADIERKYDLGRVRSDAINIARSAQREAEAAIAAVNELASQMGNAIISIVDTLPSANEALRGKMLILRDKTEDRLFICVRYNGGYVWRKFAFSDVVYLVDVNGTNLKTANGMYLAINA